MDKMREEFEKWAEAKYSIDESKYGGYISESTQHAWQAWQASRQALVVRLPDLYVEKDLVVNNEFKSYDADDVRKCLSDAGIKWAE